MGHLTHAKCVCHTHKRGWAGKPARPFCVKGIVHRAEALFRVFANCSLAKHKIADYIITHKTVRNGSGQNMNDFRHDPTRGSVESRFTHTSGKYRMGLNAK